MKKISLMMLALGSGLLLHGVQPLELLNRKSGISLELSGVNGKDYAVEHTYADGAFADSILYLKNTDAKFSLSHNENNVLTLRNDAKVKWHLGKGDTPEFGVIYAKFDHDMLAHDYTGNPPSWIMRGNKPFSLPEAVYKDGKKVLGATGHNNGKFGVRPLDLKQQRFYYGSLDKYGNEWHTLTYWDDDLPALAAQKVKFHRQGASDGYLVNICVRPKTPVLQFSASEPEQFYTTPVKTYFTPVIHEQTTYATGKARLSVLNLTDDSDVLYRADGGEWKKFPVRGVEVKSLSSKVGVPVTLSFKCGDKGVEYSRTLVIDPKHPAPEEKHGFLLWKDEEGRRRVVRKVGSVEPFKAGFRDLCGDYHQNSARVFDDMRGNWRQGASDAVSSMNNAVKLALEFPAKSGKTGELLKKRLLYLSRLEPVGNEDDVNRHTPGKDFLNELGQTIVEFTYAAVAYDLAAGYFRSTDDPAGMTPVEEYYIRDGMAKIAKTTLQFRSNYSAISGSGDTHWPVGYEIMFGTMALAMPEYNTPYYGMSGGNFKKAEGKANFNPFPDQFVSWYEAATDSQIKYSAYPNVKFPFRYEFLLTDDGWWTGPNDLSGNGDRYFTGPGGRRLVDIKHHSMFNAEGLIELEEMGGYEAPFVVPGYLFVHARRLKGDNNIPICLLHYQQRRLVDGITVWKSKNANAYIPAEPAFGSAVLGFSRFSTYGDLPQAHANMVKFMELVKNGKGGGDQKVFSSALTLAICENPADFPAAALPGKALPPTIRPMFKYVIKPGQKVEKPVLAYDLQGRKLKIEIKDLPAEARFDEAGRKIVFQSAKPGIYPLEVIADNGQLVSNCPFVFIVKETPGAKVPMPQPVGKLKAELAKDRASVRLSWTKVPDAAYYMIYREGALRKILPANTAEWTDRDLIIKGSHTRYHISYLNKAGTESGIAASTPEIVSP